jgi:predicted CxxxxCH...CXXCH cytochrome family protein
MLLVSVQMEYGTATAAFAPTVTFGGQTVTEWVSTNTTASRQKVWFGFLNEAGLDAAAAVPSTTLNVTLPATPSASVVFAAVYDGVLQTTPDLVGYSAFVSSDTVATSTTFGGAVTYDAGSIVIFGAGQRSGTGISSTGYTMSINGPMESARFWPGMGYIVRATAGSSNDTVSFGATSNRYAVAAVSLRPAPTGTPPGAPGNPTYTGVSATGLTANWTAPATGTTPFTYTVDQGSSSTGPWTNVTGCVGISTLTCAVSGLTQNTTYWYRVTATNVAGSTASGSTSQLTSPAVPAMAAYTNVAGTSVTVNWTASAPTTGLTYTLQRGSSSTGPWTTVTGCTAGAVTCNVTGLTAGTTYWFHTLATNATASSAYSTATSVTMSTVPGAPGNPTYTGVSATGLTANWTAPATGTTPFTYTVDQGSSSTGPWTNVTGCVGISTLTCAVSGLTQNTTYWYRVTATNVAGSTASGSTSQLTSPAVPAMAAYTNVAGTSVTVNWTASAPTTGLTYTLQRGSSSTGPWTTVTGCTAGAVTCNVTGLTAGTTYWFHTLATNATASSAYSTATSVTTSAGPTAPSAPGNPTYASVTTASMTVNWTASASGTAPISYTLARGPSGTGPWTNVTGCVGISTLTCAVSGLTQNTAYFYQVTATNSVGSTPSAAATSQLTLPGQPALGAYTSVSQTSLSVNWTMALPTSGLAYRVQMGSSGTGPWSDVSGCTALAAPPCNVTLLTAGTTYWFQVSAANGTGSGAYSTSTSVATLLPFVAEGSPTPGAPMVSIINPRTNNVVRGPFRVQIRVFNPDTQGGIAGVTAGSLAYSIDDGATWSSAGLTALAGYDKLTGVVLTGRTYEVQLSPSVGAHALRARVSNALASNVLSNTVEVTVSAAFGDGNLLVRDNSSQLCGDCHGGLMTHSTEATGTKYGAWSTNCRDCHTAHSTTNLSLINQQIKPPERTGPTTAQPVTFLNTTGFAANSYAQPGTGAGNTGVCEVCHTKTAFYQADGLQDDGTTPATNTNGTVTHSSGPCGSCHKHNKGLGASCTACHGDATETRTAAPGADSKFQAAPPIVSTSPNPVPNVFVANGGEHLKHVTVATYRAAPVLCNDCHTGASHQATPTVEIGYSVLATGNGVLTNVSTPALSPPSGNLASTWTTPAANANCTNWCHGDGLAGGGRGLTWNWATAQTTTCSSCHGQATVPMPNLANAHHPQNSACGNCHGAGYATTGITLTALNTHIDGTVQHGTGCRACHGAIQPAGATPVALNTDFSAAPGFDASAVDSKGNTARTFVGVGAHIKHVNTGTFMSAKCGQCHVLPADGTITHADGALAWSWTAIAGIAPSYTSPNCTNYCHSNAAPLGGTVQTQSTISWTSTTTPMGCTTCHQTATFGGSGLSTRHSKHLATYSYTCDECHTATMADNSSATIGTVANHVNGAKDVTFSTTALVASINQAAGSYTSNVTAPNYTCASTYCHSGGVSTTPGSFSATASAAIPWNSLTTTTCQTCHGFTAAAAPTMGVATGSLFAGSATHMNHVANTAVIGTNYVCGACHQATVAATTDSPITNAANHVNGNKDVSIATRGGFIWTGLYTTAGGCTTVYCHSSGQASPAYQSVNWTDTWTSVCNRCHGTGNNYGSPDYTSGAAGSATANSHSAHTQVGATSCVTCHSGVATAAGGVIAAGGLHTNGTPNVAFSGLTGTPGYSGAAGTPAKQCSNVACHGNNPVQWGAKLGCRGCHGASTGATVDDDVDDYTFTSITAPGTLSKIDLDDWTANGHGATSLSTESGNTAPDFDAGATADGCVYCHDVGVTHGNANNFFRLANVGTGTTIAEKNGVCTVCHDGAGYLGKSASAATQVGAYHYGADHGTAPATYGGQLCWDCHDPHGDRSGSNRLAYMIQKQPVRTHANAAGVVTEWGVGSPTYAATPDFRKAAGTSATAWDWGDYARNNGTPTALNGVCQVCHTKTLHFTNGTWSTTIPSHSDADSTHNVGKVCTTCHAHNQKPSDAFRASCSGCHGNKSTPRTPVTANADAMLDYAPPTAADGTSSATTVNGVGAHQSHVNQITLRTDPLLCSQCHGTNLPVHPGTGLANISWGALATTGTVSPTYTRGTGCAATYCHGNFKNGNYPLGSLPAPTVAPTGLATSNVAAKSLTLSWTKVSGASLYMIERGTTATPTNWAQIGTTAATSYADAGLAGATVYTYRVKAWTVGGAGPVSATTSATTLTAGAVSTVRYDLYGTTAENVGTETTTIIAQTSYTYNATTTRIGRFMPAQTLSATQGRLYRNATNTANTTFTPARIYTPALTAAQNPVNASVPISIDYVNRTVVTNGIGRYEADLIEYNGTTGDVAVRGTWTSPNILQTTASTTTWTTISGNFNNPEFGVQTGNRLKVVVRFVTGATAPGDSCFLFGATQAASATAGLSRGSSYINPTYGSPAETVPTAAPTGLVVSSVEANAMGLTWNAVAGATSYLVERSPNGSTLWTQVGKPATTAITDGALTANTPYWYRVTASSTAGNGPVSAVVTQTTLSPANGIPSWTGTFTAGSTTLACSSCHGNPPGGTHPSATNCSLCHPTYGDWAASGQVINKTQHINGVVDMTTDCAVCHAVQVGNRRPVAAEFGMKWSHKRSAGGVVNKWDCIVCHMEGDPATGALSSVHMDGLVNLRDPDTGLNIQNVTFTATLGGAVAGNFGAGTGNATFTAFSRNLGVAFENDPNFLKMAAIEINQCMKCHDTNGALAFNAGNPLNPMINQGGTRSAAIPFGTAITYAAVPANEGGTTTVPSGTQTAGGVAGGVIRLDSSFLTSNSSYHPVLGRGNNTFVYGNRAATPFGTGIPGRTAASSSVTNFGYLLSCWDCHALPADTNLTQSVTAHGGPATIRGTATVAGTPSASNAVTLCVKCHAGYNTTASTDDGHAAGSAFSSNPNQGFGAYTKYGCNICHSSTYKLAAVRPIRAEDTHGTNVLPTPPATPTPPALSGRWATDPRPYAFIRNREMLPDHSPAKIGTTTYTPTCNPTSGSANCQGGNYTVGGTY